MPSHFSVPFEVDTPRYVPDRRAMSSGPVTDAARDCPQIKRQIKDTVSCSEKGVIKSMEELMNIGFKLFGAYFYA